MGAHQLEEGHQGSEAHLLEFYLVGSKDGNKTGASVFCSMNLVILLTLLSNMAGLL